MTTGMTGSGGETVRVGLLAGLVGGVAIWIYEAVVWVGIQHLLPLAGIPANATGLVFGKATQHALGPLAYAIGIAIHFAFALGWGVVFALSWPALRRRGIEATLAALGYAVIVWVAMHVAVSLASSDHPAYTDPTVVIGGILSHIFYTVPLALVVKRRLNARGPA